MRWLRALRAAVPTPLRKMASRVLPLPSRLNSPNVSDIGSCRIGNAARLDVYWLEGDITPGPGASVLVHGDEVMRLDCLGPNRGHMHINLRQSRGFRGGGSARLYFREQAIAEQIERACFELEHNLSYALALNNAAMIRHSRITPAEMETAVAFLRAEMLARLERHSDAPPSSAGA